mgnify:CR=1 FL=1
MFKMIPWDQSIDLSDFYKKAEKYGYVNNASQHMLIDCFNNESKFQAWILYKDDVAVGSTVGHSLPELGQNAYRICSRICAFPEANPIKGLMTKNKILYQHQNFISQFFFPIGIEWAGFDSDLYMSTHPSEVGSQQLMHRTFCPTFEKMGVLSKECDIEYRGHLQTFWKINPYVLMDQLNLYQRW